MYTNPLNARPQVSQTTDQVTASFIVDLVGLAVEHAEVQREEDDDEADEPRVRPERGPAVGGRGERREEAERG